MASPHEFIEGFCKWCGALPPGTNCTCPERPPTQTELRPEPARRQIASEDFDTIGARLAELEKEREAARNRPADDGLLFLYAGIS